MLSKLHSLNLKLCSKQYNKKFVLHLIVAPQLSSGWRHNYSTKTRQAGQDNEQSVYFLLCLCYLHTSITFSATHFQEKNNVFSIPIRNGGDNIPSFSPV
jgi:hypothetical protein